jgi:small acid-soluble spore protein H (minor)
MNFNNASELVESKGYVDVVHNNKSVWIEQLNEKDDTALVKEINSDNTYLVPLSQLSMTGKDVNNLFN